jgi:N-dimethylarginine dimethylaminohydrolase
MTRHVLLCPPTYFDVRDVKNPYMQGASPVDHKKARRQWEGLRHALEKAGARVETIQPVPGLEDMVFAANPIFVGRDKKGKFIVPSEMRFVSRQREVPHYVDWFHKRGYRVIYLDLVGECLEGHGDLLWHPDRSRIWAGYGIRSTRRGVEKFSCAMQELGLPVTPLQLIDSLCYHLDTCFCPLNMDAVLIHPHAFSPESLATIHREWKRVYELSHELANQFVCNGVVINGSYITSHLPLDLAQALKIEGLTPSIVETTEFEKSGGSVFCITCFFD